jgi:hypothetical protein
MAKTVMKLTETLAIVKISGAGTETITLNSDLLSPTQTVSGTPKVGIGFINWTAGGDVTITRNSVEIYKLYQNTGEFDLSGNGGMLDTIQGTSNIAVTIVTGGVVFLTLRKIEGYASMIEPWRFGSYDNTGAVGS